MQIKRLFKSHVRPAKGFLAWPLWFDGFSWGLKAKGFLAAWTLIWRVFWGLKVKQRVFRHDQVISRDFFFIILWIIFMNFVSFFKVALVDWIFVEARPQKWMPQLMTSGKLWGPRSKNRKYRSIKHWKLELWPRYFTITT